VRSLLTSILALIVSLLVGGTISVWLAEKLNATEEWTVVFMLTILMAGGVTFVFLIVQLGFGSRRAAAVAAIILLAAFALLVGSLVWAIFTQVPEPSRSDVAMTAGLVVPGVAIVLVQWLIVRWRAPRSPEQPNAPRFGRGGQVS